MDDPANKLKTLPSDPEPLISNDPLATLIEKGAPYIVQAIEKQGEAQQRIAETNKSIYEGNIALEKQRLTNQQEALIKQTDANVAKDRREFWGLTIIVLSVLIFFMLIIGLLFYRSEYQFAQNVIAILVSFLGGLGSGSYLQKRLDKKS
jgi:hypothetical protein